MVMVSLVLPAQEQAVHCQASTKVLPQLNKKWEVHFDTQVQVVSTTLRAGHTALAAVRLNGLDHVQTLGDRAENLRAQQPLNHHSMHLESVACTPPMLV